MDKYIKILELLIEQHVFIIDNSEKINLLKARKETKLKLLEIKEYIEKELEKIC
jgi:hypothetical protein